MRLSPLSLRFEALIYLIPSVVLSTAAHAGPPYQTDDPEPVDHGHFELYVASEQTRTADGTSGSRPLMELNYGAAPNIHIGIGVEMAFDQPAHDTSQYGFGDVKLSLKYRFIHESDFVPTVAFFPMVSLPTGDADRGTGNGATELFLPLWFQKNVGDWQINTGGGYHINHADDAKSHWSLGWQVQRKITEQFTCGVEIFHDTEESDDEGASTGFSVGGVFDLSEKHHILLSAGQGLSNRDATNRFSTYIGYQMTW